ncbi:GTP cyclohydrolase II [Haliangium ochraceum DSM 14365]|uniref:GTP cyclohydrolase-2 n=2 Tax=Haliangium ochraceum TaxID=80816 RepID=D0LLG6_HALO1|nr:GTP cyclohydrolase II [Haliangium ochraceum DSM 14365]
MKNLVMQKPRSVSLEKYATSKLPTIHGQFEVTVYRYGPDSEEALAVTLGSFAPDEPTFVRVHSECYTGEVLGSLKCDCREQLELALTRIQELGRGVLVYLRQEGRGIGLGNKIRAYALQDQGADTVQANHQLGFATDLREFDVAAEILKDLGVARIHLHTNNPEKIQAMEDHGIELVSREPAHGVINPHNRRYLETKHHTLGHDFAALLSGPKK